MFENSFEKDLTFTFCNRDFAGQQLVFSHREMNEKDVFDPLRKRRNERQTVESEEDKNDVRYQNRTEITLGCE